MKKEEKLGTVYVIKFSNNKNYYGFTMRDDPWDRIEQHCRDAFQLKKNLFLHHAIRKYGQDDFLVCWLHYKNLPKDKCIFYEKFYILANNAKNPQKGYNMTDGGEGASGYKMTEEAKGKISKANSGENHWTRRYPELAEEFYGNPWMNDPEKQEQARQTRKENRIKKAEEIKKKIPENEMTLKQWRLSQGLTMKELGKKLGINPSTLGHWEKGRSNPTENQKGKWIKIYGFDPCDRFNLYPNFQLRLKSEKRDLENGLIINQKMRDWRTNRKLFFTDIAKELGYSSEAISNFEKGKTTNPNFRHKWIEVYGFDPTKEFKSIQKPEYDLKTLKTLNEWRESKGLTYNFLANQLGISHGLIINIEKGKSQMKEKTVKKWIDIFGFNPIEKLDIQPWRSKAKKS